MNNKNELEALNNCLNYYNLTGYKIHEYFQQDKRRTKQMYFLTDEKGVSLTGHWEYLELNHWIGGYGKAFNKFNSYDSLLKSVKDFVNAVDIIVDAKGYMTEERRQVYVSIQKSLTYTQAREAIKTATL